MNKELIENYLDELFENPKCELNYTKDYELLMAIVLSAQSTDKRVNECTKILFKEYKTLEELKEILLTEYDVDIKEVEDILDTHYISIDESDQKDDDNANVGDMLLFNSASASRNLYERESDCEFNRKLITNMLQKLTPREQEIIKMVFGIGYDREYELQEIGAKLGLTTERVRQLKFSIIDKLKLDYKSAINRL